MELETITAGLASNARVIHSLAAGYSDRQARWRPDPDSWSILEVLNHLLDEEREDFRARIELVFNRPDDVWFSIDPERWVIERGYNQRKLDESLAAFMAAREESLTWLASLETPDWDQEFTAPFGKIRAGDFLVSWLAHDVLHSRQLVELRWACQKLWSDPYDVRYAGEW